MRFPFGWQWASSGNFCGQRLGKKRTGKKQDGNYGTEGMCLGMCFGTVLGTTLVNNTGLGTSLGMLIGLVIGLCMLKAQEDKTE